MQLNYERQANDIKKAFDGEQQQRFLTIAKIDTILKKLYTYQS